MQKEFNLHNINILHGNDAMDEEKVGLSKLLTAAKLFYIFCLTYLFAIPILYKNVRIRAFLDRISLPVPSIILGILFIYNWIISSMVYELHSDLRGHGIVEIKETIIALIVFLLPLSFVNFKYLRNRRL